MKHIGLERDLSNEDIPVNHSIDAKNGVNSKIKGASINEGGFKIYQKAGTAQSYKYNLPVTLSSVVYKRKPIGEILIDDDTFVIFSLGYTSTVSSTGLFSFSEIGLLQKNGNYIALINDYSNTEKFSFNPSFPYTGEFTRNYLNEILIVATDNNFTPLYINITKLLNNAILTGSPLISFVLNDYIMFPTVNIINTSIKINDTGGTLENGVYYLSYIYENEDLSINSIGLFDNPISIFNTTLGNTLSSYNKVKGDLTLENTSKSLSLTLTNVNTNFKNIKVLALIKRNGVTYSKYISNIPITSSTLNFTISNSEQIGSAISLSEALTPTLKFNKVYKFTQVYNRLYAARTSNNSLRSFQKYANTINLKWCSKLISPLDGDNAAKKEFNYDSKTFAHKEVYAMYIHLVLTDGTVTEGFHIPYNRLNSAAITSAGYRAASTLATNQGLSALKFQLEDTSVLNSVSGSGSNSGAIGEFGFWENQDEFYPNTDDFAPVSGSQDLRGQKVRHHRFPSINWFKQNVYNFNKYGTSQLDQLGILVSNVNIPTAIRPFVKSWFISYAQRDYNNSTVVGQSIVLYESSDFDADNSTYNTYPIVWSSGFNFRANFGTPVTPTECLTGVFSKTTDKTLLRFYDLNLLKNRVDINPSYVSNELMLISDWDYEVIANCNGGHIDGNNAAIFEINYIKKAGAESISTHAINYLGNNIDVRYRKINSYKYLENNVIDDIIKNNTLENTLFLDIDSSNGFKYMPINVGLSSVNNIGSWFQQSSFWNTVKYRTYLTTLMNLYVNCYNSLDNQKLVNTGIYFDVSLNSSSAIYKGDNFTNYYSFHTSGWGGAGSHQLYVNADGFKGLRNIFTHVCETPANIALRSSDNNTPTNKFYPESAADYIKDINREEIVVNTLYNSDYSSINNIGTLIPYQFNKEFSIDDFYKINRNIAEQSESLDIGWRTWLANDYYIVARNKGKIINIEGYDRTLIIHTENSLMFTVGNEELKIDTSTAFVGSGNIFERPAYELLPSKEGNFGTQHRFSCKLTSYGYFGIDVESGIMFILSKSGGGFNIEVISNNGFKRWMYNNLKYTNILESLTNVTVTDDNPYFGFGYTVGYDNEFRRLIITKKAYTLTDTGSIAIGLNYLEYLNNRWILNNNEEITFDNVTYFINKGFTISYDLDAKKFTFFHDYYPNKYFNSRTEIFCFKEKQTSVSQDNRIFKLNQSNKGIYDNTTIINVDSGTESATPYPFYIVPVINHNSDTFQAINLSWITRVFNNSGGLLPQETFTKVLAFTSYQSTPDTNVVIFNFTNYFDANTRNIKNEWFYNKLRDYLVDTNYNSGVPFINNYSELNSSLIDVSKSFEKIRPLEDKWLAVKFTYDNINQNEIHILQISAIITPINR
jgi:hypothetical protein